MENLKMIQELKERFPEFLMKDENGDEIINFVKIVEMIDDLNDNINEKDYQIQYLLNEIEELNERC